MDPKVIKSEVNTFNSRRKRIHHSKFSFDALHNTGTWIGFIQDKKKQLAEYNRILGYAKKYNFRLKTEVLILFDGEFHHVEAWEILNWSYDTIGMYSGEYKWPYTPRFKVLETKYIRDEKDALSIFNLYSTAMKEENPAVLICCAMGPAIYQSRGIYEDRFSQLDKSARVRKIMDYSKEMTFIIDTTFYEIPIPWEECHGEDLKKITPQEFKTINMLMFQDYEKVGDFLIPKTRVCQNWKVGLKTLMTPLEVYEALCHENKRKPNVNYLYDLLTPKRATFKNVLDHFKGYYKDKFRYISKVMLRSIGIYQEAYVSCA